MYCNQLRHQAHRHRLREERINTNTDVPTSLVNAFERANHNKRREYAKVLLTLKNDTNNKGYTCSCGKHFKTSIKFKAHQSTHTPNSTPLYICQICNKGFPIRSYLSQHLVTHEDERKHKCTMCMKMFKRLAGLNQVGDNMLNSFDKVYHV